MNSHNTMNDFPDVASLAIVQTKPKPDLSDEAGATMILIHRAVSKCGVLHIPQMGRQGRMEHGWRIEAYFEPADKDAWTIRFISDVSQVLVVLDLRDVLSGHYNFFERDGEDVFRWKIEKKHASGTIMGKPMNIVGYVDVMMSNRGNTMEEIDVYVHSDDPQLNWFDSSFTVNDIACHSRGAFMH